jgi:hypothetical protein
MRPRLVLALTVLLLAAGTGATVAVTGGGAGAQLNASVTQYNSQCFGPGGTPGSYCAGNNLAGCAHDCNGNHNPNCAYNCWGNDSSQCQHNCVGNNSPQCTSSCWGANDPRCATDCHSSKQGAPPPPPECSAGTLPPSCFEPAGGKSGAKLTASRGQVVPALNPRGSGTAPDGRARSGSAQIRGSIA